MTFAASGTYGGATCPCLFVAQLYRDSQGPIIWVFTVSTPSAPAPAPQPSALAVLDLTRWLRPLFHHTS
jgi:hypothetical protein